MHPYSGGSTLASVSVKEGEGPTHRRGGAASASLPLVAGPQLASSRAQRCVSEERGAAAKGGGREGKGPRAA